MYNEKNSVPVRETEVSRVMSNLLESVERLTQAIDATEARLEGVVRNTPSESCDKTAEPEYNTKFAQGVNDINRKVVMLRERLDSLLSRIEL